MAYNVFKRPMFKRGGSTTGTGIMSHVEPKRVERVKAAMGFPNFGVSQGDNTGYLEYLARKEKERKEKATADRPIIDRFILGPRYTDPNFESPFKNFFSDKTGFESLNFGVGTKGNIRKFNTDTGDLGSEAANDAALQSAINNAEMQKIIANAENANKNNKETKVNKNSTKDKPAYEVSDIETEIRKETNLLKDLLKDENLSKGEMALVIAGALGETGTISDKVKKATELALPIARRKSTEDKAITLAAYKAAKEKEQQEIKAAGKSDDTNTLKNIKAQAEAISKNKGETRTVQEITDDLLKFSSPPSLARIAQLNESSATIKEAVQRIANFRDELKTATKEQDKKRIQADIERQLNTIRVFDSYPEFETVFPGLRKAVGLKDGGRVMKAIGGEAEEEDDIVTSKISFGSGSQTTTEPVQQLGYNELRDRLPPEITDDVVNLIANNTEALQEFAYIQTQDDVNAFNVKYGVNLVIPPTRA